MGNRRRLNRTVTQFTSTGPDSTNGNSPSAAHPTSPAPKLSVMYLDIDRFKIVNDTFGHAQGDNVLVGLADTIQANIRQDDLAFRVGGEEFAVWLPNTDHTDAYRIAERIRTQFAQMEFPLDGIRIHCTVSIGIARFQPTETTDRCLIRADKALYSAKEAGRNRTHVAPDAVT